MGGVVHLQKQSIGYLSSGPNDLNNHSYFLSTVLSTTLSVPFPTKLHIFTAFSCMCCSLTLDLDMCSEQ